MQIKINHHIEKKALHTHKNSSFLKTKGKSLELFGLLGHSINSEKDDAPTTIIESFQK